MESALIGQGTWKRLQGHRFTPALTQGQATKEHPMMECSCRDLPGGFWLGTVTGTDSQHPLRHSPLPSSLHPGAMHWRKGRGSCRSRGQDSHQPRSGCVTEGITFPQGRFIHIPQGQRSLVCKTVQLWQGLGHGGSGARHRHKLVAGCSKGLLLPMAMLSMQGRGAGGAAAPG